jgi:hypothetical protein
VLLDEPEDFPPEDALFSLKALGSVESFGY